MGILPEHIAIGSGLKSLVKENCEEPVALTRACLLSGQPKQGNLLCKILGGLFQTHSLDNSSRFNPDWKDQYFDCVFTMNSFPIPKKET